MEKSESIPYGRQDITEEDIKAVIKVLRSDFLTQGPSIPAFEEKLCNYTGTKYSVAVNSCTSALHIACLALNLGPGDILWTSPISFVASANCGLYCGAQVDFVDIDEKRLTRIEAIINSMTLVERHRPQILDGSRRKRIARGSGTKVQDVNQLIKQFQSMRKMMKKFGKMNKRQLMKNLPMGF